MRWTATETERVMTELPWELRLAGAARLLDRLVELAPQLGDPTAWCLGLCAGRSVLLAADRRSVLMVPGAPDAAVTVFDLAEVSRVVAAVPGLTIEVADRRIHLEAAPSFGLAAFVAHVATRLPADPRASRTVGTDAEWRLR